MADVLRDPRRFHEKLLADPIEGRQYGRRLAKLYYNADGSIIIYSYAHGRTLYRLHHDAAYIEAQVTAAGEGAPFVLGGLMAHVEKLRAVDRERLLKLAAKLGQVTKTTVKETIVEEAEKARADAAEAARERLASAPKPESEPERDASDAKPEGGPEPEGEPKPDWADVLEAKVAALNKVYFVAAWGGSVRIVRAVRDEALGRDRLVFLGERDMCLRYSHIHLKVGETQRGYDIIKGLGDAWINHSKRRTYDRMALITDDGKCPANVYNMWRGFGIQPQPGAWDTIETHLRSVICPVHDEHYRWLIGWLAYCVQYPGRQAEVAVVLRGLKGTGKGLLGQMLMRIFRDHALQITQSKHLVGHFNAHLMDSLFLFLDEALWAGDKQGEGTLKALITERMLMIEPKGVDPLPDAEQAQDPDGVQFRMGCACIGR